MIKNKCIFYIPLMWIFISDMNSYVAAAVKWTPRFLLCNVLCDQCSSTTHRVKLSYLSSVWWVEKKGERKKKSMSNVSRRWSNYLFSLPSFQSELWAWLTEYNPLIRKWGRVLMWADRCLSIRFDFFNCSLLTFTFPLLYVHFNKLVMESFPCEEPISELSRSLLF